MNIVLYSSGGVPVQAVGPRLTRRAEFVKVETTDDAVQLLTDCMANGMEVQLEYLNSGWRTVTPYGWSSSSAGNLLVMCYKNGTEVRSYRLDRVLQLYVDSALYGEDPEPMVDLQLDELVDTSTHSEFEDFQIPPLPNVDQILTMSEQEEGTMEPFDDGLATLEDYVNTPAPLPLDAPVDGNDLDEDNFEDVDVDENVDVDEGADVDESVDQGVDVDESIDVDQDVDVDDEQGLEVNDDAQQGDQGFDDAGEQLR